VSLEPSRIAHILRWSSVGGTEIATLRLMQHLPQFTHLAFLATEPSRAGALFADASFPVIPYRSAELSLRWPLPFIRSSIDLARNLRRFRANLVHCSDVMATLDAALAARLAGLPVVCHVRNPHDEIAARHWPILRLVSHFVFVSEHARDHFYSRIPPARASVIYDGLSIAGIAHDDARAEIGREFKLKPGIRLVAMVARLAPQKDHATFLRAARRVVGADPNTHFFIVGDCSSEPGSQRMYEHLLGMIAELGLADHVTFTGFRTDVAALVAAMDVMVLATHFEGFGLAVLEAMAEARPVVATAVGGIPEFVRDGETGLLHRHSDAEHLASQIQSVLRDATLAARLGKAGRHLVETEFSPAHFSHRIADLYAALLARS
jgi:glycosyltransferase involved in cell wall biosynthesis